MIQSYSEAAIREYFSAAQKKGIKGFRFWLFDAGKPPTDSAGNLRFAEYPLGSNIITNPSFETNTTGWALGTAFTRSNLSAQDGTWAVRQVSSAGTYDFLTYDATVTQNTDYVWTFWYKTTWTPGSDGQNPVAVWVGTGDNAGDNGRTQLDAGYLAGATEWTRKQVTFNSGANTLVHLNLVNHGGTNTSYFDNHNLSVVQASVLTWRESQWVVVDRIADLARQYGLKLYPCLADNTTNYNTKATYVSWANAVYDSGLSTSSPYVGFFDSDDCRTLFKQLIHKFATRVNTINGRLYSEDDVWNFLDLGNELRYDVFDAEGGTQNTANSTNIIKVLDWITEISAYAKSLLPNTLIGCSSASHTWQWTQGDRVSNGSGYGRDYGKEADIATLDFIDFHHYPTQSQTELHKFGQRLGYPDAISKAGHDAQLADYVSVVKAKGKAAILGEFGFDKDYINSNDYYPLNPRWRGYKAVYDTWYGAGGDGIIPWSAANNDSGSYDVNIVGYGGTTTNNNSDDRPLMKVIVERIFSGTRKPISAE